MLDGRDIDDMQKDELRVELKAAIRENVAMRKAIEAALEELAYKEVQTAKHILRQWGEAL